MRTILCRRRRRLPSAAAVLAAAVFAVGPVPHASAFFNVGSPAVFEDHLTLGLGRELAAGWLLDLGYYRGFEADVTGAFVTPAGPVPGTRVTHEMEVDSGLATITFRM